jgi:hypothetical protein
MQSLAPKLAAWPCLTLLLIAAPAGAQESPSSCPIDLQKVDPHSYPFTAGMLGSEKDPWDHYLRIEYKNASAKTIIAIRFGVAFVDALAEADKSVYAYDSDEVVKPGKVAKPYWGDGVYFHQYGTRMGAIAWVEKVRFSDNTFFVDDGSHSCALPKRASESSSQATASVTASPQSGTPETANPTLEQAAANSEAAKGSPAAAAALANVGRALSPQELTELVQKGQASKCAIVTVPPGADIEIDGNKLGVSPVAFVLLKQGDTKRTITIRMSG